MTFTENINEIPADGVNLREDLKAVHVALNDTLDAEGVRDAMAATLVAGNNIDLTVNDPGDTITVDVEPLASADVTDFGEAVSDQVGSMVTGNTENGVTVTYQDADNTLDFNVDPRVQQVVRTAGDFTTSSTTYVDVTGMNVSLAAVAGDLFEIGVSGRWSASATVKRLDAQCTTSGNYCSGGTGTTTGVAAWGGTTGVTFPVGGSIFYTVVSGDIATGSVAVKLRAKCSSATSSTIDASDPPLHFWVKNHGQ